MKLPYVATGNIDVKMILKCANDIHNVEGGKSEILDEIGVVNESLLSRDLINDLTNKTKETFFQYYITCLYKMALDLLKRGF